MLFQVTKSTSVTISGTAAAEAVTGDSILLVEVLNQNSTKMVLAPAGWKGKGVLIVSGLRSSDPSSVQPYQEVNITLCNSV